MRILMLLENEFRKDGRVEKEIKTLHENGHEIIVAAISHSDLPLFEQRPDCTIIRKQMSRFILKSSVGALKFPFYFGFWRKYVKHIVLKHKPEAIHIHDLPLAKIGIEIKKEFKIKFILDLHENWPALLSVSAHTNTFLGKLLSSEKQWREYEKKCTRSADAIITVVDEMKNRITLTGIEPAKIIVLENTPESSSVKGIRFNRNKEFFTLFYVGGISYHRGIQHVIEGINNVSDQIPVRLWIAGDGKHLGILETLVSELNLENKIRFFGHVPKPDELLEKADAGLIPHLRSEQADNSSPNKLYEYMAAGLPIIASNCISVNRVIEETNTGKTYIYDSPEDFARAVTELYNESRNSEKYSENGKKWVREKYNWETGSKALIKLYSELSAF